MCTTATAIRRRKQAKLHAWRGRKRKWLLKPHLIAQRMKGKIK